MANEKFNIEPGMVISHFRLEKMLGEGGMGVVYLAEDITLSRKVAIKFMHKSMLDSLPSQELREQVEQRFIREAKSVAGISHTNIAQVYEANFSSDNWYIVMEFIKGRPLDEILKEEGAFSEKDALRILDQTAKGLKYAWDNCNVVHRDIKPQNLMLTFDNFVKIVDLGLAKPVVEFEDEGSFDLTGAGIPVGTPFYMSPEQAVAGKVDYRADMFALGATVYELLANTKTYMGKTQAMIYGKKINQDYKSLTKFGFKRNIAELIDKLLEPSVKNRYETWDELIYDIRLVRKGQAISKSNSLPDNFDPMQETLDENSQFGKPPSPDFDPMADTIDENTQYDLSKVKSSPDADPMEETLDENTQYDLSKVKSSPDTDPMEETLDENTPFDLTAVQEPKEKKSAEVKIEETYLNCDVMAETMIPAQTEEVTDTKKSKPAISVNNEEQKLNTEQIGSNGKNTKAIIISIFAITAIAVCAILFYKPNPTNTYWPLDKWETYLTNHEWLSSYHVQSATKELKSLNIKDDRLLEFIVLFQDSNLIWLNNIYEKNKHNLKFISSPSEVEKKLNSPQSSDKLKLAVLLQTDAISIFKKLSIHEEVKKINSELSTLGIKSTNQKISQNPSCFELIDYYKKTNTAKLWITRLKENNQILDTLSDNAGLNDNLIKEYQNFRSNLDPYSASLSTDSYNKRLKDLKQKQKVEIVKTAPTNTESKLKVETNLLKDPLKELKSLISQLEKDYDEKLYTAITQKFIFLEEQIKQASEDEKTLLATLKEKHKSLKRIEQQLFIHVDNPSRIDVRTCGPIKIVANQDCFYAIIYAINSTEIAIRDPSQIKDTKVLGGQSKTTNAFKARTNEAQVLCFTYEEDIKKLFNLQIVSAVLKTRGTKEFEALLNSLNPLHFSRKTVTIQQKK